MRYALVGASMANEKVLGWCRAIAIRYKDEISFQELKFIVGTSCGQSLMFLIVESVESSEQKVILRGKGNFWIKRETGEDLLNASIEYDIIEHKGTFVLNN